MQKPQKDLLRTLVTDLRHLLLGRWDDEERYHPGDLDRELERLGFGREGSITALDALPNPTTHDLRAYRVAEVQLANLPSAQRVAARSEIVERAAYSWINRLLALRAMEARGLIEETLRPNPAYEGISEALFILRHSEPAQTRGADGGWWSVIETACRNQAAHLPGLFDLDDPNTALRPSTVALLRAIQLVGGGSQSEALDAALADPDAIGWDYQFYQQEAKARVYAKLGRGGKVESRREIAAATQLFTEPYMVKWLLQNSLGRSYHEAYPQSKLPEGWEYYIKPDRETGRQDDKMTGGQDDKMKAGNDSVILSSSHPFILSELTLLDPSMGSGHILREGFDMLFAMYREQQPELPAAEIAQRILRHHLFGIDIDPRAAQLATLTLVLRAWELIRATDSQFAIHHSQFTLNLATTPTLQPGSLERHLTRHPEDETYRPILAGLFAALEQAQLLGSLLRPEEHLEAGLAAFRKQNQGQLGLLGESSAANRLLEELGKHDPAELKRLLLERIGKSFAREAKESDVSAQLLGREASEGMHLLEILGRKYAVVATNPPYMGSANLSPSFRQIVEAIYEYSKRDLYTAFIERCTQLCKFHGFTAMITLESWLQKSTYKSFRSRILGTTDFVSMVVLGRHAFAEVDPPGLPIVFILQNRLPLPESSFFGLRLDQTMDAELQAVWLKKQCRAFSKDIYRLRQDTFRKLPNHEILLNLTPKLIALLTDQQKISDDAVLCEPMTTGDNVRYVQFAWEHAMNSRWMLMSKGGGMRRWRGLEYYLVEWAYNGARIKAYSGSYVRNEELMFEPGITFSAIARLGVTYRAMAEGMTFGKVGPGIFTSSGKMHFYLAALNSNIYSFLLRALNPGASIILGNIGQLPVPPFLPSDLSDLYSLRLRYSKQIYSYDLIETIFDVDNLSTFNFLSFYRMASIVASIDAIFSSQITSVFGLDEESLNVIYSAIGTLPGIYPLVSKYDNVQDVSAGLELFPLLSKVQSYLATHIRTNVSDSELLQIKLKLRNFYDAGPGIKNDDSEFEEIENQNDIDESFLASSLPIPTETFLEELSVKLQIHPISVYWLLEELRSEGVRCKPEEKRLLEDRLTVWVLQLLGHRWPKQIEAGETVPDWADQDGIVPLVSGMGEATLAERIRQRLRAESGDLGAQQSEALLYELTNRTLDEWLRRDFFKRHISQFKKRPIAWHLASTPQAVTVGRKKLRSAPPVFECMVYYHACNSDILARIRTQYVEPLLAREERHLATARQSTLPGVEIDETAAALANARLHELRDFANRLRQVEESGFACAELEPLVAAEPLDRWSGDGVLPPTSHEALLAQEQAWRVDLNDGVRVNIAPLQQAGLLAQEVLNAKDLRKASADRARWRADERRWVRQGKLPRCGWLDDSIPESPRWTELAPEREAERQRLAEKRQKVLQELQEEQD